MLFIDWGLIQVWAVGVFLLFASVWVMRAVRKKRALLRVTSRLLGACLAAVSVLLLLLITLGSIGCNTHGIPIYSPNGKYAARCEDSDSGGLGGDTGVQLFADHGFDTKFVFMGGWKSVESQNVRWLSDTELEIDYIDEMTSCNNAGRIKVRCIKRPNH